MEREEFPVEILFLGGGVASLSSAIHLAQLINQHNSDIESGKIKGEPIDLEEQPIAVIEKGAYFGAHAFSGAVVPEAPFKELFPDLEERNMPIEGKINEEHVYFLTSKGKIKFPIVPRNLKNKGNLVVSLVKITQWLAEIAEELGIMLIPEFAGTEILTEGTKVTGIRTGDKGVGVEGEEKSNFEPGNDIQANCTIFGEGSRGHLTKRLIKNFNLEGKYPMVYELGVKEVFELPEGKTMEGVVHHATGYPLGKTGGGSFFYGMGGRYVTLGIAGFLDTVDPTLDMHQKLQELKMHPLYYEMLKDAKPVFYGGKTLSAGGYYTIPSSLTVDGAMLIGESAGLVNPEKLKGIHLAIHSGMLAAKSLFKCMLAGDYSQKMLAGYDQAIKEEILEKELRRARNFHGGVAKGGIWTFIHLGLQEITGGRGLQDPIPMHHDSKMTMPATNNEHQQLLVAPKYDNQYLMDKLSDVYHTGTVHEEQQPCHLKIQDSKKCDECFNKYAAPCIRFCPANVYEEEQGEAGKVLKINFTNCVHCKTCDIKCPYDNVDWTAPEGGGGPKYTVQ